MQDDGRSTSSLRSADCLARPLDAATGTEDNKKKANYVWSVPAQIQAFEPRGRLGKRQHQRSLSTPVDVNTGESEMREQPRPTRPSWMPCGEDDDTALGAEMAVAATKMRRDRQEMKTVFKESLEDFFESLMLPALNQLRTRLRDEVIKDFQMDLAQASSYFRPSSGFRPRTVGGAFEGPDNEDSRVSWATTSNATPQMRPWSECSINGLAQQLTDGFSKPSSAAGWRQQADVSSTPNSAAGKRKSVPLGANGIPIAPYFRTPPASAGRAFSTGGVDVVSSLAMEEPLAVVGRHSSFLVKRELGIKAEWDDPDRIQAPASASLSVRPPPKCPVPQAPAPQAPAKKSQAFSWDDPVTPVAWASCSEADNDCDTCSPAQAGSFKPKLMDDRVMNARTRRQEKIRKKIVKQNSVKNMGRGGSIVEPAISFWSVFAKMCFGVANGSVALESLVDNSYFDNLSALVIIINAVTIGAQTDYMARNSTEIVPDSVEVLDKLIAIFFFLELVLRMLAFGGRFWYIKGCGWNYFDFVLVALQVSEEVMRLSMSPEAYTDTNSGSFKIMRIMRILRLMRVVRVVRVLRLIGELRCIVASVAGSLQSLGWTVVLLLLLMYMVGVYFTQTVTDYRLREPEMADPVLADNYSSVPMAIYMLYQAVSGGVDWGDMCGPLMDEVGLHAGVFFIFYVAFVLLCILNVVTGVFVDSALKNAHLEDSVFMVHNLKAVFDCTDEDKNGALSLKEFTRCLHDPDMRKYFEEIDLNPDEAMTLFTLLDIESRGEVDMDEFVSGCIRLRGQAKAVDLITVMWEHRHLARQFLHHSRTQNLQVESLQESLEAVCLKLGISREGTPEDSPRSPDGKQWGGGGFFSEPVVLRPLAAKPLLASGDRLEKPVKPEVANGRPPTDKLLTPLYVNLSEEEV